MFKLSPNIHSHLQKAILLLVCPQTFYYFFVRRSYECEREAREKNKKSVLFFSFTHPQPPSVCTCPAAYYFRSPARLSFEKIERLCTCITCDFPSDLCLLQNLVLWMLVVSWSVTSSFWIHWLVFTICANKLPPFVVEVWWASLTQRYEPYSSFALSISTQVNKCSFYKLPSLSLKKVLLLFLPKWLKLWPQEFCTGHFNMPKKKIKKK